MEIKKFVRTTEVVRLPGGSDTVTEGNKSLATNAWNEFLRKETVEVAEGEKYVPFHAIDHLTVTGENKTEEINDDTCESDEPEPPVPPVITWSGLDVSYIHVDACDVPGTEYDTKTGVKAYADGVEIPFTATPSVLSVCEDQDGNITFEAMGETVTKPFHVYIAMPPTISGVKDLSVEVDETFDALDGVSATDGCGNAITVQCDAPSSYDMPGEFGITYTATDKCGNVTTETATVTVSTGYLQTVLYDDGTFVVNETALNPEKTVLAEFEPYTEDDPYVFASGSEQPWYHYQSMMTKVEFGSQISPETMAYWFQNCTISEFDFTNLDTSNIVSMRACFAGTQLSTIEFPPMPNLENMQYMMRGCSQLEYADMSDVGSQNITNMTDAFQGCYMLGSVDFTGLGGTVQESMRTFANINNDGMGNMTIVRIWASAGLDFSQSNGASMFRSCVDLFGAIPFDPSVTDATYANLNGYFSERD